MAQQTNELVRSKDVLEMHVQARTQELQKLQRAYESILNRPGKESTAWICRAEPPSSILPRPS